MSLRRSAGTSSIREADIRAAPEEIARSEAGNDEMGNQRLPGRYIPGSMGLSMSPPASAQSLKAPRL
jgi:hypothetical protein